jgi:signal transduction histidine kinase
VMPNFERLRDILAPYPQATVPVARLLEAINLKLAETEETIELRRQGRLDDAIAIVRTDRGKDAMDEARLLFDGVIRAADERLTTGVEEQRSSANWLRVVTILGGVIIFAVVGGAVWMALAYTRDLITAREEVQKLNADLEGRVAERTQDLVRANEEVQRFAYIVTHDLRAPLVNIMGFTAELDETMKSIQAYVLADEGSLSAQQIQEARQAAGEDLPEAIGFIRSSTKKMDSLINAILKISRDGRRSLKPEPIELQSLVEHAAASVEHQVAETEGSVSIEPGMPRIVSDRLSLEQIVGNLLDNAVKYRAKDRPVEIRVVSRQLPGNRVAIDVVDNGRGIAAQDHQRVFDLFRRSGTQDKPGEGIGLAHVRSLVRNLGGDITLDSEFGKGTTFTVTLARDVRSVMRSMESS